MSFDTSIKEDDKYVIFHAEGGHGKCVAATAVCRAIKKAYPDRKLIVVTAWDASVLLQSRCLAFLHVWPDAIFFHRFY